jgi:hypothetical protein
MCASRALKHHPDPTLVTREVDRQVNRTQIAIRPPPPSPAAPVLPVGEIEQRDKKAPPNQNKTEAMKKKYPGKKIGVIYQGDSAVVTPENALYPEITVRSRLIS